MNADLDTSAAAAAPHTRVLIIGAGFSGLGLGIKLRAAGEEDFIILEAAAGVGGTWWVNRYPGCACDVQSHLYSFSFVPRPDWSRQFAPRAEIQRYLADCVDRHGLAPHLRFNTTVTQARWDEGARHWRVTDQHGQLRTADVLVSAIGGLSRPAWPDIPGLEKFAGPVVHSQQWPDELALSGKRVAVIGTGASAIQFVPHLQRAAQQLDVYQRSAQWILPKPDRAIRPATRALYRWFPPARWLVRLSLFLLLETRLPAFARFPRLTLLHRRKAQRHLRRQVDDPALVAKLTPDYAMGCKRVLLSNDFYPAISAPNVELVTTPIRAVGTDSVTDAAGVERPADVIILGTGFQATAPVPAGMIIGRDGQDLNRLWAEGPAAYKGTTVAGFPNFFTLLGPNTALGHNSVILMIEGQIRYVVDALRWMQQSGTAVIDVRAEAQRAWNERLQQRLGRTVWNSGGCRSWYLHPVSGRNATLWPRFTTTFRWLTRRFDAAAYRVESRGPQPPP
ncbi:MAG: flavin-containing monooxygenase, partial [Gammaproteobacteria bacterium]